MIQVFNLRLMLPRVHALVLQAILQSVVAVKLVVILYVVLVKLALQHVTDVSLMLNLLMLQMSQRDVLASMAIIDRDLNV